MPSAEKVHQCAPFGLCFLKCRGCNSPPYHRTLPALPGQCDCWARTRPVAFCSRCASVSSSSCPPRHLPSSRPPRQRRRSRQPSDPECEAFFHRSCAGKRCPRPPPNIMNISGGIRTTRRRRPRGATAWATPSRRGGGGASWRYTQTTKGLLRL